VKQGNHQQQLPRGCSPFPRCGLKDREIVSYFPEIYDKAQLKYYNDKYIINFIIRGIDVDKYVCEIILTVICYEKKC
jgi:hypothetical protein